MFDLQRTSYRGAAVRALRPSLAPAAQWNASAIPTLENAPDLMVALLQPYCTHWEATLSDLSGLSLDSPLDGNHKSVLSRLAGQTDPSIQAMSQAFTRVIAPLGSARAMPSYALAGVATRRLVIQSVSFGWAGSDVEFQGLPVAQ